MIQIEKNKIEHIILPISKIIIISVLALFLLGFFFPYYELPNDSRGYGLFAMRLIEGEYEFSSELLSSTGEKEFIPASWIKTVHNTAIPDSMPGIAVLGAFFYIVSGEAGLFYLGPIFAICFLIASERISTKFFGPYVGLLTLCFLATNEIFFWVGRGLLTSNIFSLFFIGGFYFLMIFLRTKNNKFLLISSSLLMIPSIFRLNGVIILPIEILIIVGYFTYMYLEKSKNEITNYHNKNNLFSKKNILKILTYTLIPWIVFFGFFGLFNNYCFDDPITSIYTATDSPRINIDTEYNEDEIINLERIKKYLNHFLPYPVNRVTDVVSNSELEVNFPITNSFFNNDLFKNIFSNYNLGIIALIIIIIALVIGLKENENRTILISFSLFILGFILFYSFSPIVANRQGSGRDVLPLMPFFYMMLSFVIWKILKSSVKEQKNKKNLIFSKIIKISTVLFLIVIIPISFTYADYSQIIKNEGWKLKDPNDYYEKFPPDFEGITKESVIFSYYQTWSVIAYGAIPFTPTWDEGIDDEHYQNTAKILENTILEGKKVYIFKDPKLNDERIFYKEFFVNDKLILKDFSDNFCEIIIKESTKMMNDVECLK